MLILAWVMLACGIMWDQDVLVINSMVVACTRYLSIKIDTAARRGEEE